MTAPFAGRFTWYELMTTDPDAAGSFYADVMRWGTEIWTDAGEPYAMWMAGDDAVGGRMALPDDLDAPPHWIGYVGVPDLDATLDRAGDLGATTLFGPHDIPSVGRIAVIADPQGAAIALHQPASDPPPTRHGPGHFGWHELATSDEGAALAFYTDLFGWETHAEFDMGDAGIYQMLRVPGDDHESIAIFRKPAEAPATAWLYYVVVPDVDAAAERASALGGLVALGPMDVPGGGRIAQCRDPQGAYFAVMTPAA